MARLKLAAAAAICGAALVLQGCGTRPTAPAPAPSPRPPVTVFPAPSTAALSPAAYVVTASSMDLFEIRSSELALTRSRSARVRDFARMMISAHKGTSAQLSLAGRRLNLLPAAFMQPAQKRMFDELLRSGNFDSVYKRQQIAGHRAALQVHGAFAARGSSPTLRPIAQAAVPIVRRHLAMALKL